jgi:hypothetical protein
MTDHVRVPDEVDDAREDLEAARGALLIVLAKASELTAGDAGEIAAAAVGAVDALLHLLTWLEISWDTYQGADEDEGPAAS